MAGLSEAAWEQGRAAAAPIPDADRPALPTRLPLADAVSLTDLEILRRLGSGPRGLAEDQAQRRLADYGENVLPPLVAPPWWQRVRRILRDPFILVLCFLAVISSANGAHSGTAVIAVLIAVSCVLRVTGERRADQDAAGSRAGTGGTATVLRRTAAQASPLAREIPVEELVPGDIVRLAPGDLVPADVRLLKASGLSVNQAPLTGESAPVAKHRRPDQDPVRGRPVPLLEEPHLCFPGSSVATGHGTALVVATGADTHFGAHRRAPADSRRTTAFERAQSSVAWLLVQFMGASLALLLAVGAAAAGRGWQILPFAIAIAVGLTPEMLPVVVTTVLARGVAALRRRQVVVKRFPALHDLGVMDILCVDKTGTLTRDRLTVRQYLDPQGRTDAEVLRWAALNSLICTELGDPSAIGSLDEALLEGAARTPPSTDSPYVGVDVVPFDPVRRRSTAVVRQPGRFTGHTMIVKGAVEDVLDQCTRLADGGRVLPLDDERRRAFTDLAERHARDGLRTAAVAIAHRPARNGPYGPGDETRLTLVGLVGLGDEPDPTAAAAVADLAAQGITVKIITGDHPSTAARACVDIGIEPGDPVLARDLDLLDDGRLARLAATTTVFARATPAQKARVVAALRAAGHTVGFLGDGVNDIPALRAADLGICPRTAVDAARESADILLTDTDLAAIGRSVPTARRSVANIGNYLRVTLSANVGNVLTMLVAAAFLPFLPMLPVQVLVQNLCFDAAQLALAFDRPPVSGALRRPPLDRRSLARFALGFGLVNTAADLATFALLSRLTHGLSTPGAQVLFHAGWFTENLITQAVTIHVLRSPGLRPRQRAPWAVRASNGALAAVGLALPLSPLGPLLGMAPLPAAYYRLLAVILCGYTTALVVGRALAGRRRLRGEGFSSRPPLARGDATPG